jgi:carboxylesterase
MNELPFARYFQTPEHQPFLLPGQRGAVLLVHGFPGSPAEMRPLGQSLNEAGWTVEGVLLPGFGPQIEQLFERRMEDWVEAVQASLRRLKENHRLVVAGGFSLGAALAMQAAAAVEVDGLALLAPYWKMRSPLWNLLPVIRRIFPSIRPFQIIQVDFNNPDFRGGMGRFMPEVDLDNPQTQAELRQGMRQFKLPTSIFAEIRNTGLRAGKLTPRLRCPTLVVQGWQDPLVQPGMTRQLLRRMPRPLTYIEVDAAHDLPQADKPAFPQVSQALIRFLDMLHS